MPAVMVLLRRLKLIDALRWDDKGGLAGGLFVTRRAEKDQGEATSRIVDLGHFLKTKSVTIEGERGVQVSDPDHGVQILHALISHFR